MVLRILIRLLIAAGTTYGLAVLLVSLFPPVASLSVPWDGMTLLAVGMIVFAYGSFMAYLFNPRYRAEMNGPPPDRRPWRNPSQPPPGGVA